MRDQDRELSRQVANVEIRELATLHIKSYHCEDWLEVIALVYNSYRTSIYKSDIPECEVCHAYALALEILKGDDNDES